MENKRLVRFIIDSIDKDLGVGVCTEGAVEKVEVNDGNLWLWRWCVNNKEDMLYLLPITEENKMFVFIDNEEDKNGH